MRPKRANFWVSEWTSSPATDLTREQPVEKRDRDRPTVEAIAKVAFRCVFGSFPALRSHRPARNDPDESEVARANARNLPDGDPGFWGGSVGRRRVQGLGHAHRLVADRNASPGDRNATSRDGDSGAGNRDRTADDHSDAATAHADTLPPAHALESQRRMAGNHRVSRP